MFSQEHGARPLHNYTVILGHAVNAVLTLAAMLSLGAGRGLGASGMG
jgi:hypothetical protein